MAVTDNEETIIYDTVNGSVLQKFVGIDYKFNSDYTLAAKINVKLDKELGAALIELYDVDSGKNIASSTYSVLRDNQEVNISFKHSKNTLYFTIDLIQNGRYQEEMLYTKYFDGSRLVDETGERGTTMESEHKVSANGKYRMEDSDIGKVVVED